MTSVSPSDVVFVLSSPFQTNAHNFRVDQQLFEPQYDVDPL